MFTGIIEHMGQISRVEQNAQGAVLTIHTPGLASSLAVSNSIAVNGCCLTVVTLKGDFFTADLSPETIAKTTLTRIGEGRAVNLEQPMSAGKEFGGHFVLGHVDGVGKVAKLDRDGDSWRYAVEVPPGIAPYVVLKGSITIDGISLTVADWDGRVAEIAVIPYTYDHTNIRDRKPGDPVNLEGDVLGKYIEQHLRAREARPESARLTIESLKRQGF